MFVYNIQMHIVRNAGVTDSNFWLRVRIQNAHTHTSIIYIYFTLFKYKARLMAPAAAELTIRLLSHSHTHTHSVFKTKTKGEWRIESVEHNCPCEPICNNCAQFGKWLRVKHVRVLCIIMLSGVVKMHNCNHTKCILKLIVLNCCQCRDCCQMDLIGRIV